MKKINLSVFALFFITTASCLANPVLDNVASGNVSIQQTTNVTTINQASQSAIINWNSFNIGANEITHFIQPAGGVALNRISPLQGASQIYGTLTATGKIILINPAGVYFGPNAFVNVGSLIATTANLTNENFLKGIYHFDAVPGYNGSIVNAGTIQAAQHGLVALVGSNVTNDGKIQANLGHVILAGGDAFTISFAGNDLINFVVDKPAVNPKVTNNGALIADGGQILVTAKSASHVLDNIINMNGIAQAKSVYAQNGSIVISGDPNAGSVKINGKLLASGKNANETGGTITLTGNDIVLDPGAVLDAGGAAGGGKILIGKDAAGMLANTATINSGVSLLANALNSGSGGFIETSAHQLNLGDNLTVNTNAPNNKAGTWLIDPTDLFIGNDATAFMLFGTNSFTGNPDISVSFLNINTLLNQLNNSNVIVQTTSGGTGGGSGNLTVATSINWSSDYSLTLSAFNNLVINNGVSFTNSNPLANLTLIANNGGNYSIASGNGRVLINGLVNIAGTVSIYTNPASIAYNVPVFNSLTAGIANIYMMISNSSEFQAVAGNSTLWNKNFALGQSIDLSGIVFNPIGNAITAFSGLFDGLGHQIKNINLSGTDNIGLFGVNSGTISNLGVSGTVSGNNQVGLLAGDNLGTIQNAFSYGLVNGSGNNVGGLVGQSSGTLTDTQSYAAVNGDTNVGGLAGFNSGTINNALSIGNIVGNTNVGALIGNNTNLINNSFFDSDTSGLSLAVGNDTGTTTATGGCYGSTCVNGGTVDLTDATTFSNAGWDIDNTWSIIEGTSYPYLKVAFPNGPRIITGQIGHFASYIDNPNWAQMNQSEKNPDFNSFTPDNIAGQQVTLATNGNVVNNNIYSGANGRYYSLNDNINNDSALIAYLTSSSNKANTITLAPTNNASLNQFNLALDTVLVTDNGQLTRSISDPNFTNNFNRFALTTMLTPIAQTDVIAARGNLNTTDILFSNSGNDLFVAPNTNFVTAPNAFYTLNGNLVTTFGSITNNGVLIVGPLPSSYNELVALQTLGGGNIYSNHILWPMNFANPPATVLYVSAANNMILYGLTRGLSFDLNGNVGAFGSIALSAAYTNQSITTGPNTANQIAMYNITLVQGKFYQNASPNPIIFFPDNPAQTELRYFPIMSAISFTIDDGVLPSPKAEFIRAGGGDGTIGNPYIIYDVFGLQGIGSSTDTLSYSYQLAGENNLNLGFLNYTGGADRLWNNGKGFIPIGTLAQPFTGTFDGFNMDPLAFGINSTNTTDPTRDNVGLFGVTGPTAVLANILITQNLMQGNNNVGGLVGINYGTINNAEVMQSYIIGHDNVGGLVGINYGTILNSGVYSNRVFGNDNVGGLVGTNYGTIENSFAANVVAGTSHTGGIAGTNIADVSIPGSNGTIVNSFWDTGATGQAVAASVNSGTMDHVTGGCLLGTNCANGGIANLSDPATYFSALDGGAGYVSSSWDFNNFWAINPGASYPYGQTMFYPGGGPAISYYGNTGIANQVLLMAWGIATIRTNGILFSSTAFSATATGADGSFYFLTSAPFIMNNNFILMTLIGGNSQGSVGFIAKTDPLTGFIQNKNDIQINGSLVPGNSNNNLGYDQIEINLLYLGLPINTLYALNFPDLLPSGIATVKATDIIFNATRTLFNNYYMLTGAEYQAGIDEEMRQYLINNNITIDLRNIENFQKALDYAITKRYQIKALCQ